MSSDTFWQHLVLSNCVKLENTALILIVPPGLFHLTELPSSSFSGMRRLEYLNLEHAGLRALALAQEGGGAGQPHPLPALRELRLGGNPLRCDCAARWLWRAARRQQQQQHNDKARFDLPRCATPFSVRSRYEQNYGLLVCYNVSLSLNSSNSQFFSSLLDSYPLSCS